MSEDDKKYLKYHKCNGCKWTSFVGTKFVCMFPRCVKSKLNIKKETDKNYYTPDWQFQEPVLVIQEKIHFI